MALTGNYLTKLPMEPKLGKMLILGSIFNCLDPVATIVAGLSVRDPFLTPMDKKDVSQLQEMKKKKGVAKPFVFFTLIFLGTEKCF